MEISDVSAYQASQTGTNESTTADTTTDSTAVTTDTSYVSESSNINISTVSTGSGDSTVTYYVADVVLNDATTLQSAFANNGDYYGFRDTGIVVAEGIEDVEVDTNLGNHSIGLGRSTGG
ncbi:UNVERIFIED_ORG: hypothetical protein ABIB19_001477 [Arthrobacter sp. UYEF10]